MAIREFECKNPNKACDKCLEGFEIYQKMSDDLIKKCPYCGCPVRQIMSVNTFVCLGDGWTRRGTD